MMKIKKIDIFNYKSIHKLSIPCDQEYGNSKTVFLLGINESGKSNILDAIHKISTGFDGSDFIDTCHKSENEKDTHVQAHMCMEMEEDFIKLLIKEIEEEFKCFKDNPGCLSIDANITIIKYLSNENNAGDLLHVNIGIDDKFPFAQWVMEGENIVSIDTAFAEIAEDDYSTASKLIAVLNQFIKSTALPYIPIIDYWKFSPQYLIDEPISLTEFGDNPEISLPLKNMFLIYGKTTNEEIKKTINTAFSNAGKKSELQGKLSKKVTSHINSIWPEHLINIKLIFDGDFLKVHIEDKDKEYDYYDMNQRSAGFKQFISLLLTLSSQYESGILKNNIILLDEPETHLHPSGIRFMRDELLKIGKNNHVFVATHSPSMVDSNTIDRHWVITKKKSETNIPSLNENVHMLDDEVLQRAFGINIFRELLPKNLILVEGKGDKKLLEYAIRICIKDMGKLDIGFKSANGVNNLYAMSALLKEAQANAYVLCDDDHDGRKCVRKIKDNLKPNFSERNVFTLRSLVPELPKNATIEDTFPRDFAIKFFRNQDYDIGHDEKNIALLSFIGKEQNLRGNETKLSELKWKLAEAFIATKEQQDGIIFSIAQKLIDKFDETKK